MGEMSKDRSSGSRLGPPEICHGLGEEINRTDTGQQSLGYPGLVWRMFVRTWRRSRKPESGGWVADGRPGRGASGPLGARRPPLAAGVLSHGGAHDDIFWAASCQIPKNVAAAPSTVGRADERPF